MDIELSRYKLTAVQIDTLSDKTAYRGDLNGPGGQLHTAWWYDMERPKLSANGIGDLGNCVTSMFFWSMSPFQEEEQIGGTRWG
jgi:hypothetical protein